MTLFQHFYNSILTSYALAVNKNGNKFINFLNNFIILFFFSIPFFRNKIKELINTNYTEKNFFSRKIKIKNILEQLSSEGYYDNLKLNKKKLNEINKDLIYKNLISAFKNNKNIFIKFKKKDNFDILQKKGKKEKIAHLGFEVDLKKTKFIKKIATSNFFLKLAYSYLRTKNISISSQLYISNSIKINRKQQEDYAQAFHYDIDFKKFFKVFIYLNNVNKINGPHSYVAGTHKKKFHKHILLKRIRDNEVIKRYKKNKIKIFPGKQGKVIIEDTFGLHKGHRVIKGNRKMLILIYGVDTGIKNYKSFIIP